MSEFFSMGGYAAYIWPAWGLSLLALAGLIVFAFAERRSKQARLAELEADMAHEGTANDEN